MQKDERKIRLKKRKEDDSDYEDFSDDTSTDQYMDETTEQEEREDLSPDAVKKCTRLR
jgi:hypothetical protein